MRTVPAGLAAHILQEVTTLSMGWIIARKDGTFMRYTNHDRPSTFTTAGSPIDGVYLRGPMQSVNAIQVKVDMSVNNVDLDGFFIPNEITEADMVARLYESANVYLFIYNWADTTQDVIKILRGQMGNIKRSSIGFTAEFRSLAQYLSLNMCSITSKGCRAQYGSIGIGPSVGCRYPVEPPNWAATTAYQAFNGGPIPGDVTTVNPTVEDGNQYRCMTAGTSGGSEPAWDTTLGNTTNDGSVVWMAVRSTKRSASITAVTSRKSFRVNSILGDLTVGSGGSIDGGFFAPGSIRSTSGPNLNFQKRILSFTYISGSTWEVILKDALPYLPSIGEGIFLIADCDKAYESCKRWGNYKNFKGEHKIPGSDVLFKVHSADGSKK